MQSTSSPAIQYLQERHISFEIFRHINRVSSLEQAAAERNQTPDQIIRSLVFRLSVGEYFMVLVNGPEQVHWPFLRARFQTNRLTTAQPEEVLAVTGYRIGTVSPFGLPQPIPILVDTGINSLTVLSLGSGLPGTAIIMLREDLLSTLPAYEWFQATLKSPSRS